MQKKFTEIKLQAHCTPNALFELFTSSSVESSHFRTVVRTYNNHFAFTSFGVKYDKNLCKSNKGIYTFRVQGQVHHYINQLLPNIDDKPSYLQLYFYDTEHELHNRLQNSDKLVEAIVIELMEILSQNPYSLFFRSLNNKTDLQNHRLQIRCHPNLDQRVYNVPSTSQVAGIWVEHDPDADVRPRDICIYGHSGDCHKVQYYYGCYDPLQYPLLFPHGEPGWHEGIERNSNFGTEHTAKIHDLLDPKKMACPEQLIEKESEVFQYGKKRSQISCREYYCYRLQIRPEGQNSYPVYKRVKNANLVKVRGHYLDNRWVVPHNRYLIAKFDCHINVEICSSIKAVKYLYKYVYKGHDRISFNMSKNQEIADIDEISNFQNGRWISPPEAAWRIFAFPLSEIHPTIISLQLHLEDFQLITYNDKDVLLNVINSKNARKTMLTEFFNLNLSNEFACSLLNKDIPTHFVWNPSIKKWTLRKKQLVIGRIVGANPIEGERYYLRVLLNHVKGPTSFEHLKTFNSIVVNTYREACLLHGLLIGDNHCEECMSDAIIYQMPDFLRKLFSTLLIICNPSNPKSLWDKFKTNMFEDYMCDGLSAEVAEKKTLHQISCLLEGSGKNLNDYQIVTHVVNIDENERFDIMVAEETIFADINSGLQCEKKLNDEQRYAYDIIMTTITNGYHATYFIDGPGGTGKTFLYKSLLSSVRSKNNIALATASSGAAASLLPNGRTTHSTFKIPLDTFDTINCLVTKQSALGRILKLSKLIIWDEAPMVNRCAIEALDRLLQDLMDSKMPFGGKVIVFGGDFRLVLPVVQRGKRSDILKASLVCSPLWPLFIKISLVQNMRSFFDPTFCEYLLRIGNEIEDKHTCDLIQLPKNITIPFNDEVTSLKNLINVVFPNIDSSVHNLGKVINRVILTANNESVDQINNLLLNQIDGEMFTYYRFDETIDKHEQTFQEDFLNSLSPNGIPPHELNLKLNCHVMLLRNINPSEGLCNGTRLICKKFDRNLITAEIISGEYIGKSIFFLPRIPFIPLQTDKSSFPFKRTQFPIRPCFAMTINKAQGQTLDFVGLYLPQAVFSHGQLYVALSRAKTSRDVIVLLKPSCLDSNHDLCTKNVVYEEIFTLMKR